MIRNNAELAATVTRVDADIQDIQDYLGRTFPASGRIRFPRRYLRTAVHFQAQFVFVRDATLRRNISYALIQSDVFHWLLVRTDLFGIAREMVIKELVCLTGSICESLTKDYLKGHTGGGGSYKKRTQRLVDLDVIDEDLKTELDWLWDARNAEHLFLVTETELGAYTLTHSNRAIRTLQRLQEKLEEDWLEDVPF